MGLCGERKSAGPAPGARDRRSSCSRRRRWTRTEYCKSCCMSCTHPSFVEHEVTSFYVSGYQCYEDSFNSCTNAQCHLVTRRADRGSMVGPVWIEGLQQSYADSTSDEGDEDKESDKEMKKAGPSHQPHAESPPQDTPDDVSARSIRTLRSVPLDAAAANRSLQAQGPRCTAATSASSNGSLPQQRLATIRWLSTPAFSDSILPQQPNFRAAVSSLVQTTATPVKALAKEDAVADDGNNRDSCRPYKATAGRSSNRRLTEEINECLQIFRQRESSGGFAGVTPVLSSQTGCKLAGRVIGDVLGTPTSRLLKSPVKMFTYQVCVHNGSCSCRT